MAYAPPFNPQVISPGKIRRFAGVAGKQTEVLKKADPEGRDLSDSFANDQFDLNSDVKGQMRLREGFIKMGDGEDATIGSIFQVFLSGVMQYGFVNSEGLTLYDIPWLKVPDVPLPPNPTNPIELPADFPASFPAYRTQPLPEDDAPLNDPSVPVEEQACEVQHTHSTNPSALNFTMQYAGTLPAVQYWYWMIRGWWPTITHYGTYSTRPAWYWSFELGFWSWLNKACDWILQKRVAVSINGKDANGDWLEAGTHKNTDTLIFTDGDTHTCEITLVVTQPTMSANTPITLNMATDGFKLAWDTITIENTVADTTLDWTAAIISDTSAQLQLSAAAGSIVGAATEDITLSFSSTPSIGSYTALVRLSGNGSPATVDVTINMTISQAVPDTNFVWYFYKNVGEDFWRTGASGWAKWVAASGFYRYDASGVSDTIIYRATAYTRCKYSGVFYNFTPTYTQDGSGNLIGDTGPFVVADGKTLICMIAPSTPTPP